MLSFTMTRKGRDHAENEDAHFADDTRGLYIVADGVGSARGAATASSLVVAELSAKIETGVPQAFRAAAQRLAAEAGRCAVLGAMASGATLLSLQGSNYLVAHVGDARCYVVRANVVTQLTRDHSVAWEQFEAGAISKDDVRRHPNQRLLTRTFCASRDFVVPEVVRARLEPGDTFLLVTDGITKEVADTTLEAIVLGHPTEAWAPALLDSARAARDDATVLVVCA